MATTGGATEAVGIVILGREFAIERIDDERIGDLIDAARLSQSGRVVTAQARTDPACVIAIAEWVLDQLEAVPVSPVDTAPARGGPGGASTEGGVTP
jgi:F420-dependent methylenetetrahydromethanopterin dehydrogenase